MVRGEFGHVCAFIADGRYWISLDWAGGRPEIEVYGDTREDITGLLEEAGALVVPVIIGEDRWPASVLIQGTCVGFIKALLGIRAPLCFTPRQLYNLLTTRNKGCRHGLNFFEAEKAEIAASSAVSEKAK